EAVKCALQETPDVILMDIKMPVINGIDEQIHGSISYNDIGNHPCVATFTFAFRSNRKPYFIAIFTKISSLFRIFF
ncbi:MAG: hypothetical protein R6V37_06145, partial [Psychroflexus maritimus]